MQVGQHRTLQSWRASSLALVLLGCGPDGVSDGSSGQEEDDETTQSSEAGDGDGDPAGDGDGDGDGDPDGDGDGDPAPGDGDGDPEPLECPAPLDVHAQFSVDPPEPVQAPCSLMGENLDDEGIYELLLDCEGAQIRVRVDSSIPYLPSPGGMMELDYRVEGSQRWLALRREGGPSSLIFGAVSAAQLDPPGTTLAEFFVNPGLHIAELQACEEPTEQPCGSARRLTLALSDEQFGELGPIFDADSYLTNFLAFGYALEVEQALEYLDPEACEAPGSFELLLTWYSDP